MALTTREYARIRGELDSCKNPLYFFHDDPDGLCSFLQLYMYKQEGYGVIVKSRPLIDRKFLGKVSNYSPDRIFVLDIAMMEQEFADEARTGIVWIDHHQVQDLHKVLYFNPRKHGHSRCVSYLTYRAVRKSLWIAVVGCISDMDWPDDLVGEFREKYPGLLPASVNDPRAALYTSPAGALARIFSNILKGSSSDAMKYVKAMTRIESPYEILNQDNARARFIFRRHEQIEREYRMLLAQAKKRVGKKTVIYIYPDSKIAFSSDLANEMAYLHPDKLVIIGREKNGEIKCSIRTEKMDIPAAIEKALAGLRGYGGGHEHAAGCVIAQEDYAAWEKRMRATWKRAADGAA